MSAVSNDWNDHLKDEYKKPYYRDLFEFVKKEYDTQIVYPPSNDIFNAFQYTPYENVKCVILGQDPYHEPGQAHGLAFSVREGVAIPASLVNIYKEIESDLGIKEPRSGYLKKWAQQGVLLLNTCLTVRAHQANSHSGHGWETFTDAVISAVDKINAPVVFMLWGSPAARKRALLHNPRHLVLTAPHPSPLSAYRGFFGCGHFSRANEFLARNKVEPIDWQL